MTLEEAVTQFEKGHSVYPELGYTSLAPNGQPYVTVVCGGIKEEGQRMPVYCTSQDEAVKWWLKAANEYAPNSSMIYWRSKPDMDSVTMRYPEHNDLGDLFEPLVFYTVYSRLHAEPLTDGPE